MREYGRSAAERKPVTGRVPPRGAAAGDQLKPPCPAGDVGNSDDACGVSGNGKRTLSPAT